MEKMAFHTALKIPVHTVPENREKLYYTALEIYKLHFTLH